MQATTTGLHSTMGRAWGEGDGRCHGKRPWIVQWAWLWMLLPALPLILPMGCSPSAAGSPGLLAEAPCSVRVRYQLELKHDLETMLALLDEGQDESFLNDFMDPRVVERLEGGTDGAFRKEFSRSALRNELHAAIQSAVAAEPGFGKDADLATFDQPDAGRRLMLRRINGRWRVLD